MGNIVTEFKAFVLRGNVVDLAVGIVVGAAFTAIVSSLVGDVLMPPLGWLMGGIAFDNFFLVIDDQGKGPFGTLKAAQDAGAVVVAYGLFINAVIKFLVVAAAIFVVVRQVNRLRRLVETPAAPVTPPAPTPTEALLAEIRDLLKSRG